MQLLTMPNLTTIKDDYPQFYDDMVKMVAFVNSHVTQVGGYSQLVATGSIVVSGSNGVIDVQITDNNPKAGEEYFVDRSMVPSFAGAQSIALGPVRNWRDATVPGTTTYWRWFKSTKLAGTSNYIVYGGTNPIGVNPGGTAGPPPSGGSSGSGGGGGYGSGFRGGSGRQGVSLQ